MSFLCDMGERIFVEYYTKPAVMRYSHVHPQYEMYFCPNGIPQRLVINGTELLCEEPCVILSPPYTIHAMSPLTGGLFERIVVYFGERTLSAFSERTWPAVLPQKSMGRLFRLDAASASLLRRAVTPLLNHRQNAPLRESEAELTFLLFLHKLLSLSTPSDVMEIGGGEDYIRRVLRYIVETVGECHDSAQIARRFAVSRSKLDRDFKRATGGTPHEFAEACRLNHAKTMLLDSRKHYSMEEIAADCGFLSETYFYSFFKKHTGSSPGDFRKEALLPQGVSVTSYGCQ